MRKRFKEWLSIHIAKNPNKVVLATIILLNILLLIGAGLVIRHFSLRSTENMGFWEAVFYTVTMVIERQNGYKSVFK